MEVYNMNPSAIYAGLKAEITTEVNKLMPKTGGTFTGNAIAATTTDETTAMLRNIVVVEADTDLTTLSIPAGTIVMVTK